MEKDPVFRKAVQKWPGNALWTSPEIQNELISFCGQYIQEVVLQEVKAAGFISVLADEATDVSMDEQMVILLRYVVVDQQKHTALIKEQFLSFVKVKDLTGAGLAETIINYLRNSEIDLNFLVGQGYDGASAMSGCNNGVQALIREQYPLAFYTHCASHALNLACIAAASCKEVRNTCTQMQKLIFWIMYSGQRYSGQRSAVLKEKILELKPNTKKTVLIELCETRCKQGALIDKSMHKM